MNSEEKIKKLEEIISQQKEIIDTSLVLLDKLSRNNNPVVQYDYNFQFAFEGKLKEARAYYEIVEYYSSKLLTNN